MASPTFRRWLCCALLAWAGAAAAQQARPLSDDPVLEDKVLAIANELRCLVCQNETIAASHADLAQDLRAQIRSQLKAGKSQSEILDYMVQRYGDFVLYRPPVKPTTYLLWGGPFLLLAAMLVFLWRLLKRRRAESAPPLTDAERQQAQALLGTRTK
jgi:cytochrome c-type biogenesis protein CcmH